MFEVPSVSLHVHEWVRPRTIIGLEKKLPRLVARVQAEKANQIEAKRRGSNWFLSRNVFHESGWGFDLYSANLRMIHFGSRCRANAVVRNEGSRLTTLSKNAAGQDVL